MSVTPASASTTPAPSTPVPASQTWVSMREENIGADELTQTEIESLLAMQAPASAPAPTPATKSTPVMEMGDMDYLLKSLGEDAGRGEPPQSDSRNWYPTWSDIPDNSPTYASRDVYPDEDEEERGMSEVLRYVGDIEAAVATVDDTTVALRDEVASLTEDVKDMQTQLSTIGSRTSMIAAQNKILICENQQMHTLIKTFMGMQDDIIMSAPVPPVKDKK